MTDAEYTKKVRELNDTLRTSGYGGKINITPGVFGSPHREKIISAVRYFTNFDAETNDPYGEHDGQR